MTLYLLNMVNIQIVWKSTNSTNSRCLPASNHPTFFTSSAPWISKMTGDAHPGALDAGLDAALMFIDADPSNSFKSSVEKVCLLYFSYVSIDFFHIMFHIFIRYVLQ